MELLAYERMPLSKLSFRKGDQMSDFVLFEVRIMQERTNYLVFNQMHVIGLPKMLVFKKSMTI